MPSSRHEAEVAAVRKRLHIEDDRQERRIILSTASVSSRQAVAVALLRDIAKGRRPSSIDLASAPILYGWWIQAGSPHVIRGYAYEHTVLRNGASVELEAVIMNSERSWAWADGGFWSLRPWQAARLRNLLPG
jgi:alpha-D-ribose 1-methylphosphonate 5-triphosphate diphosphatase PhnM